MNASFENLQEQLETSKRHRNGHLAQLKSSFDFELEDTPKLKNILFQELAKRKGEKNWRNSSKS